MTISNIEARKNIEISLLQGNSFLKAGKLLEAKSAYEKILNIDPKNVDALFRLGFIAFRSGEAQQAIELFSNVLIIQPNHPKAVINLANIYGQLGQTEKAFNTYKTYIAMDQSNPEIYYYLGFAYVYRGETELAIEALQKSVNIDSENLMSQQLLGSQYYNINDFTKAQKAYEAAFGLGCRSFELYEELAKTYKVIGKIDKASEIYNEAFERFPEKLILLYHLSRIDDDCIHSRLEQNLKAKLKSTELSSENKMYCYFVLAKCAHKDKRYLDEITMLLLGHEIQRINGQFRNGSEFYLEILPNLAASNKAACIKVTNNSVLNSAEPIFIVGVPRSGSTLIESVLVAGKQKVKKGEECGVMLHTNALSDFQETAEYWQSFVTKIKENYQSFDLLDSNPSFSDKSLDNFFVVDIIINMFPKAKIIWCRRDPVASIVSILQNNMLHLPWAHNMDEICQYFAHEIKIMDTWVKKYPDKIYVQSYERFVSEPEQASKSLFEFCELPWDKACLDFHKKKKENFSRTASNVQIRKKVNQSALNVSKKYAACFDDYFEKYPNLFSQ